MSCVSFLRLKKEEDPLSPGMAAMLSIQRENHVFNKQKTKTNKTITIIGRKQKKEQYHCYSTHKSHHNLKLFKGRC
jgi:hypothetical protein